MSQCGVSVRTMSHKCESYESVWSKCENGESGWSKREIKEKRVHVWCES